MTLASLVETLFERCRLVDLSAEVHPGIMYADGRYRWGSERRRFELKQWVSMGNHFQTFIDAGSHVGTHVDMPCHIHEGAKAADGSELASADMPLQTFFGEGVAIDCGQIAPRRGRAAADRRAGAPGRGQGRRHPPALEHEGRTRPAVAVARGGPPPGRPADQDDRRPERGRAVRAARRPARQGRRPDPDHRGAGALRGPARRALPVPRPPHAGPPPRGVLDPRGGIRAGDG